MAMVNVGGQEYYINKILKNNWNKIRAGNLKRLNEDRVYIVDGRERSGKSTFTAKNAAYIDPTILNDVSRITYSVEETLEAIRKTESDENNTKVIWWDEAFRGLSSKGALSKLNKRLVQALMEMGEKNLVLFIVSPSFFLLEMYAAILRSNTLFHIVKDKKSNKRFYRAFNYNQKAMLYNLGIRKGWSYNISIPKKNKDWFDDTWPGGEEFRNKYLQKKRRAISSMDEKDPKEKYTKEDEKYFIKKFIKNWKEKQLKIQQKQLSLMFDIAPNTLRAYKSEFETKNTEK